MPGEVLGLKRTVGAPCYQSQKADNAVAAKESVKSSKSKQSFCTPPNIKTDIELVQAALTLAGFEPGPIDGGFGKKTERAIRAFQKMNCWTGVDGRITPGDHTDQRLAACGSKRSIRGPGSLKVHSVILKNCEWKKRPGMTGFETIRLTDGALSLSTTVRFVKWVESNPTGEFPYEYPTEPGSYEIKRSPRGAKYLVHIASPKEGLIRFHSGWISEGCIVYGKDPIGRKIYNYLVQSLVAGHKISAHLTVTDKRKDKDKRARPLPYS